jgi:transcriptional regulator with XRE-family HTH domain
MTQQEFLAALERLGIKQREAARRLGVNERTVRSYALGEREPPGPVVAALEAWLELRRVEAGRSHKRRFAARTATNLVTGARRAGGGGKGRRR